MIARRRGFSDVRFRGAFALSFFFPLKFPMLLAGGQGTVRFGSRGAPDVYEYSSTVCMYVGM